MNVASALPAAFALVAPSRDRPSRRVATRREVVVPCQAVREHDFKLIADHTLDVSIEGLLLPIEEPVLTGETLIISFPIPGMWIDCEASVTRVVHNRRPSDDGLAIGVVFDVIQPSARAALAAFLHGKPPPLPRRGPLARLRRGEGFPRLADESAMQHDLIGVVDSLPRTLEDVRVDAGAYVEGSESDGARNTIAPIAPRVDGLGILREMASAWKRLGLGAE